MSDGQAWAAPTSGVPEGALAHRHETPDDISVQPDGHPAPVSGPPAGDRIDIDRAELLGGDIPLRPLGIAEILDGAIANIRHNPRAVLGLSLVITTVVQVLQSLGTYFLIGDGARDEITAAPVMRSLGAQFTLSALGLLMSGYAVLLLAGMLGPAVGRTLFGLPTSLRQVWHDTRSSLPRLFGVTTLIMTISVPTMMLPIAPFVLLAATNGPASTGLTAAVIAGVIGFPVGLCLLIWLYVLFVLATPAVVIERQGVFAALARAQRLVRGRWWRMCGVLLLTLLITIFMGFFALRVPFVVAELVLFGAEPTGAAAVVQLAVDTAGRIVSWTLTSPFDAGVIALLYVDRRMRREGFDLELQTCDDSELRAADFLDLWRPSSVTAMTGPPFAPHAPGRPR
jgi:hypothetical protein